MPMMTSNAVIASAAISFVLAIHSFIASVPCAIRASRQRSSGKNSQLLFQQLRR